MCGGAEEMIGSNREPRRAALYPAELRVLKRRHVRAMPTMCRVFYPVVLAKPIASPQNNFYLPIGRRIGSHWPIGYCVRLINTSSRSGSAVLISRTSKLAFCTSANSASVVVLAGSKLMESRPSCQTAPSFCNRFWQAGWRRAGQCQMQMFFAGRGHQIRF